MKSANSFSDAPSARDRIVVEVDILKDKLGCLIGTGGSNLKAIVAACNNTAQISVPDRQRMLDATPPQGRFATVTVTGQSSGVFQAIREIQTYCDVALVEAHIKTRLDPVYTLAFLQSDNDRVDALFNIRTQHDVKIGLDRRDSFIAVEGAPADVEASVAKITKMLPDTSAPPARAPKPSSSRPSASSTAALDRPKTAPSTARTAKASDAPSHPKHEASTKTTGKKDAHAAEGKGGKSTKEPKQQPVVAAAGATSAPVAAESSAPSTTTAATAATASTATATATATSGDAPAKKKTRGGRGKKKGGVAGASEGADAGSGDGGD